MAPDTLSSILSERMVVAGTVLFAGFMLCTFITIWIVIDSRHKAAREKDREESRREIAAYVAEGSMTAEDAARILSAGGSIGHRIMNELGELKKRADARSARGPAEPVAGEGRQPQAI